MDSKLLYIRGRHLLSKINWSKSEDFGWVYCGRSEDLKVNLIEETVSTFLDTEYVYFITTRTESKIVNSSEVLPLVIAQIDKSDFTIWSDGFLRVISFDDIGVFRTGTYTR